MADIHDQAKRRILDAFPPSVDPVSEFRKHSDDFYLDTLSVLAHRIPFRQSTDNQSLKVFLYAGCLKFDRWFAPSPFVVQPRQSEHFEQFARAISSIESADNSAVFALHQVRDALYSEMDGSPTDGIPVGRIAHFRGLIRGVDSPSHPIKVAEFDKELSTVNAILDGLEDRSFRTVLTTRLPYVLSRSPLSLSFLWKGTHCEMALEPSFSASGETDLISSPAAVAVGASRWQSGTSRIRISLRAFVDVDAYAEPLQSLPGHDSPLEGWPQGFTLAFSIIHDVAWRLRLDGAGEMPWIPAPRDLGDIEVSFQTAKAEQLAMKRKSSPANLMRVFSPTDEVIELDLGDLTSLSWSAKCRAQAMTYMELGEMNEALFWLNVATEALFRERIASIAVASGQLDLEAQLGSPRAFWAPAEEVVSEQFPALAGKVKWPDAQIHVSVFAKLRYLHRAVAMKVGVTDVLARYRIISQHRNDLFHGTAGERLPMGAVQRALESFDWLVANFVLAAT